MFDLSRLAKFDPPKDAQDMQKILAVMVIEMRIGSIDPSLATKIAFVGGTFLKAFEFEALKQVYGEIEKLKERLGAQEVARKRR